MTGAPRAAKCWTGPSPPGASVAAGLLVSGAVTALTLGVSFTLLFLGVEWFWVAYPVGFGVVLPAALGAATYGVRDGTSRDGDGRRDGHRDDARDPTGEASLDDLRRQYARGAISEAEFERRVERLLDSETER